MRFSVLYLNEPILSSYQFLKVGLISLSREKTQASVRLPKVRRPESGRAGIQSQAAWPRSPALGKFHALVPQGSCQWNDWRITERSHVSKCLFWWGFELSHCPRKIYLSKWEHQPRSSHFPIKSGYFSSLLSCDSRLWGHEAYQHFVRGRLVIFERQIHLWHLEII